MKLLLLMILFACLISACTGPTGVTEALTATSPAAARTTAVPTASPTPTPRQFTICAGQEPGSLFLYGDNSPAARSVREAIYDGPVDVLNGEPAPVILDSLPSTANGGAALQPVQVSINEVILDSQGNLANLIEGVSYTPSGCSRPDCALTYSGSQPVIMDELVVRYHLLPGLQWSDGTPLTASDSLFSFNTARAIQPGSQVERLSRTRAYTAIDDGTIEWRGIPGWRDPGYESNFFSPLPVHALGELTPAQIMTSTLAARSPLGWGPYILEEWSPGKHISLVRNPQYAGSDEGLPRFDRLVFQFYNDPGQAVLAFQSDRCDVLDASLGLTPTDARIAPLVQSGRATAREIPAVAWEHLDFGIVSAAPGRPAFWQSAPVRQAVAQCIDRQKLAETFSASQPVPDSYLPAGHPLANPEARRYTYDPDAAGAQLQATGWQDADNNPATARTALGVVGVPDGTPFTVNLLTTTEEDKQLLAEMIQKSLAGCGIQVEISAAPAAQIFTPGPDGQIFGRQFDLAQFAWPASPQPPCWLYTTQEIAGAYPQSPKGWGGANLSGYSNPQYDLACQQALNSLPDSPDHLAAHWKAQSIFAEDLPAVPLFSRSNWVITRPDLCGLAGGSPAGSIYWNLEEFDYGKECQ